MSRVLIIGGSDAGISAALRAREIAPHHDITMVVADAYPNYSICGLPFFLSGETPRHEDLAHRTLEEIESHRITLLLDTRAIAGDAETCTVTVVRQGDTPRPLLYDELIIATGAQPIRPAIDGLDNEGVHVLHDMADAFRVKSYISERKPKSAVIIGAGYIGLEMADALRHRGVAVTLLDQRATVLQTVDSEISARVRVELESHAVKVVNNANVHRIEACGDHLTVIADDNSVYAAELVLVVVGVRPVADLLKAAGAQLTKQGAAMVDERMGTGVPHVWAAGDCVMTHHRLLPTPTYLPLGTTAHKQGRVAGENAAGGNALFQGVLGTQVVEVFDRVIGRTGLRHDEAAALGFEPFTRESAWMDHKAYYPGATELIVRVTADARSRKLLGAQLFGSYGAEISKRIDVFATALFHGMSVDDIWRLDLSYTPPLSSPWDPVQMAVDDWVRAQVGQRT